MILKGLTKHILEKISDFVGKWMAVVVLAIAALSLFVPKSTLWIELSWVNYLLMIVIVPIALGFVINNSVGGGLSPALLSNIAFPYLLKHPSGITFTESGLV